MQAAAASVQALFEVISDLSQYFSSSAKPSAYLGPKTVIG
jgi:hypothetical protein